MNGAKDAKMLMNWERANSLLELAAVFFYIIFSGVAFWSTPDMAMNIYIMFIHFIASCLSKHMCTNSLAPSECNYLMLWEGRDQQQ